jgi:hypothetical protein
MVALTADSRAKGFQAMQQGMTAAQRAARRLKAGRGPVLPNAVSILEAVHRLDFEAERARSAMRAESLNPEDVHLGLLFSVSTPSEDGLHESLGRKWRGAQGKLGEFIAGLEKLAEQSNLMLLGIVWAVIDREANKVEMWAKPLIAGQEERLKLAQRLFQSPYKVN